MAAKTVKKTARSRGTVGSKATFKPIGKFVIPTTIQKKLHQLAMATGSNFNEKYVCQRLAAIVG